jgi:hypothetical protein
VEQESPQVDPGQQARRVIDELSSSVWAFAALTAALQAGLLEFLAEPQQLGAVSGRSGLDPSLAGGILDVLVALGLVRLSNQPNSQNDGALRVAVRGACFSPCLVNGLLVQGLGLGRPSLLPRSRRRPLEPALAPCHGQEEQQQPGSERGHPRTDLDGVAHALEEG